MALPISLSPSLRISASQGVTTLDVQAVLAGLVGSSFHGSVTIDVGPLDGAAARLSSWRGWRHSSFTNCRVAASAAIENSSLDSCNVGAGVVITNCAHVGGGVARSSSGGAGQRQQPFVFDATACVGNSTGGRVVPISDILSFPDYCVASRATAACNGTDDGGRLATRARLRAEAVRLELRPPTGAGEASPFYACHIGKGAILVGCAEVTGLLCRGPVTLLGATSVTDSVLYATAAAPTIVRGGSTVSQCVLHPGVAVESGACLQRSVLFPGSGASNGAGVTECIVAGGTVVGRGEASNCLLGPFVGCHHTSLLIASLWPEGKGNIAAGALVGSNHTGKLPDQEARPGEGVFFGLGVSVKFPASYERSPYSLVAAGTTLLPQRVEFPFSLISPQSGGAPAAAGLSPAINELLPGWMLSDNVYAVYRNESKFASRAKALLAAAGAAPPASSAPGGGGGGEGCLLTPAVAAAARHSTEALGAATAILTRPALIDLMRDAQKRLVAAAAAVAVNGGGGNSRTPGGTTTAAAAPAVQHSKQPAAALLYTDTTLEGCGKNFVAEAARVKGVAAYDRYIRLYALRAVFLAATEGVPLSPHAAQVAAEVVVLGSGAAGAMGAALVERAGGAGKLAAVLAEYARATQSEASAALSSKRRDDERGRRIQGAEDYDASHTPAERDAVVVQLQERAALVAAAVSKWEGRRSLAVA